jgi:TM2 domain-containing membrane protein YozV
MSEPKDPYAEPEPGQPPYPQAQYPPDAQAQYGQAQYGQAQYGQPPYPAAYGQAAQPGYPPIIYGYPAYDPVTGLPLSDKSRVVAGVLGIVLGGFGAGRFYTGHTGMAIAQIAVTWLTCGIGHIWPLIDGIILLAQGGTDANGRVLRS